MEFSLPAGSRTTGTGPNSLDAWIAGMNRSMQQSCWMLITLIQVPLSAKAIVAVNTVIGAVDGH